MKGYYMKVYIAVLFCLLLSGCANFIANQITSPRGAQLSGNFDPLVTKINICDDSNYCIKGQEATDKSPKTLTFEFKVNEQIKVWNFKSNNPNSIQPNTTDNPLILVFPGYIQPSMIMAMHQHWLKQITGAEVIVLPSPDESESFKFGLDLVSPVLSLIEKKQPRQLHVIGFSMGALAAQDVATRAITNPTLETRLHLIAPMTDFRDSTLALWDIWHKDKLYSTFISDNTIEEAIKLVYQKSNLNYSDTNLVSKANESNLPTFVYASTSDLVTSAKDWEMVNAKHVRLNTYEGLKHFDMVTLTHTPLLRDFVSNLLNKDILLTDTDLIGTLYIDQQ